MTLSILKSKNNDFPFETQTEDFPFGTVEQLRNFAKHRDGDLYIIQGNDFAILDSGLIKNL